MIQGEKFDPEGIYIKRHIPELAKLPTPYLFSPWNAPTEVLEAAGISLGETYPYPIVDFSVTRRHAQAAFDALEGG